MAAYFKHVKRFFLNACVPSFFKKLILNEAQFIILYKLLHRILICRKWDWLILTLKSLLRIDGYCWKPTHVHPHTYGHTHMHTFLYIPFFNFIFSLRKEKDLSAVTCTISFMQGLFYEENLWYEICSLGILVSAWNIKSLEVLIPILLKRKSWKNRMTFFRPLRELRFQGQPTAWNRKRQAGFLPQQENSF